MNANTIYILSAIFSIAATVLAFIFITPKAKRNTLNKFGKFLHDILNFKSLLIEKLLKGAYILSTAFVLFYGFLSIFQVVETPNFWGGGSQTVWVGYIGFVILLLGPIVVRIAYEFMMMAILMVKNVIEINKKMGACKCDKEESPKCEQEPEVAKVPHFCALCGNALNANGECDHCKK
jgi:hypothetical protein